MNKLSISKALAVLLCLMVASPVFAQATGSQDRSRRTMQVAPGVKTKVKGVVIKREGENILMRDQSGADLTVRVAANTRIQEKKSNPFRSSKKYTTEQVVRGLNLEVEGQGDGSGALVAERIKFEDDDLRVAYTVDSTVVPIENRIGVAEDRLTRSEQNAERLSGQVEELSQVANLARGGAAAAQESADAAIEGVNKTNDRVSSLDDYDVGKTAMINFRVGSAVLSPDAKTMLDDMATQAKSQRGFVIEVRGFASSDGSESLNRSLSQRRSESVVRYLAEKHDIPLRRIILPFGYGEAMPIADNTTRDGRRENRRAEVRLLISRGLTTPVTVNRPVSSTRE
jgi:outer membrane protein OmpA-like peptidoglycan-associated protein